MLAQCWTIVCDDGPTLSQRWVGVSCLLVGELSSDVWIRIGPSPCIRIRSSGDPAFRCLVVTSKDTSSNILVTSDPQFQCFTHPPSLFSIALWLVDGLKPFIMLITMFNVTPTQANGPVSVGELYVHNIFYALTFSAQGPSLCVRIWRL